MRKNMARYLTLQNLSDTSIVNGDLIGQIGFAASNDSDGGDAIAICSSISVKAEGTFNGSNNPSAIIFATAPNNGPTDRLKVTNEGHFVPIADISYDLGVSGSLHFRDVCLSGIVFNDGTYQTTAFTGGGGGGGGSPGGSVNQIQINDGAGGFTAATDSDRLVYNPSTNILDLGRQIGDNTSGTQVTNYFYANNFAIGGDNFLSLNSLSDQNTAIGIGAAQSLSSSSDNNVAVGYNAMNATTSSSSNNIFIGNEVANAGGTFNSCIAIGSAALDNNSANTIQYSIAIGHNSLGALSNGPDGDTAIGYQSMANYNESAAQGYNTAIGYQSMYRVGNGQFNVAIGANTLSNSLFNISSIDYNVVIGYNAAFEATSSFAKNTVIGALAFNPASTISTNNSIIIGYNAIGSLSLFGDSNIIISNRDIYGDGGLVASDTKRLLIGDTLGGNLNTKRIKIGGSNVVDVDTAVLEVECNSSTDVGLLVQGAASQSANLQEWQDSSATVLASMDKGGRLYYQSSYSPISDKGTASSFTFDLDTSNVFSGTLSAASTLLTSNGDVGQRFLVRLKQGSGGSKTVSSWFNGRVSWPGGSAPTLSSTEGHVDLFGFLVTSGTAPTLYYDGFTIATGIQ